MNPTILHSAIDKLLNKLVFFTLVWQLTLKKENSELKLAVGLEKDRLHKAILAQDI